REVHHATRVAGGHGRQIQDDGATGAEVLAQTLAVTEATGALDDGLGHGHQAVLHEVLLGRERDGAAGGGHAAQGGARPGLGGVVAARAGGGLVDVGASRCRGALVGRAQIGEATAGGGLLRVPVHGVAVVVAAVADDRAEVVRLVD